MTLSGRNNKVFDQRQYVPVLRWKRAERIALRMLDPNVRAAITPLVEIMQKDFDPDEQGKLRNVDAVLVTKAKELSKDWGPAPVFVDVGLLSSDVRTNRGQHPLRLLAENARTHGVWIIPVTGLTRSSQFQRDVSSIASNNGHGICIRVGRAHIEDAGFGSRLLDLVRELHIRIEEVDLILDYQITDSLCRSLLGICERLPEIARWRTFTFISGAFSRDLQDFEKNLQHLHPRHDWLSWSEQAFGSQALPRVPSFGDYTIQYPIFQEPPEFSNPSASIRYASDAYWVIMRGEGINNDDGPGRSQWPANAQLLCERSEYAGRKFSYGDNYIYEMGSQTERTGSPETWLRAGINHHLTYVVHQLSMSFGSSTVSAPIPAIGRR